MITSTATPTGPDHIFGLPCFWRGASCPPYGSTAVTTCGPSCLYPQVPSCRSLDTVPDFLDSSVTLLGFSKACLLACRVQPLRFELIECRPHVISKYNGDGRRSLEFRHSRRCFFSHFG